MRFLTLFCLLILTACAAPQPVSRIDAIRTARLPALTKEIKKAGFKQGAPLFLRTFKQEHILEAWLFDEKLARYRPFKTYRICHFSGDIGPKQREGDKQAPEGFYNVTMDSLNPQSEYHLSMNIGYPNAYDMGLERTGSFIMIHGGCKSSGCFAMTDPVIEEVYLLAEQSLLHGQQSIPVHSFPFRLTVPNLFLYARSEWIYFWLNLKQGYDLFEIGHIPPQVDIKDGAYVFSSPLNGS